MNRAWGWKQAALAVLVATGCAVATRAAEQGDPCQTGRVLVVPWGGPGSPADGFVTAEGTRPNAETRATAGWDDSALTVAFDCADSNIVASQTRRDDGDMWRDDCVEVFLDPGHAHHHKAAPWLHVLASASGGLCDSQGGDPWFDRQGGDSRYQIPGLTSDVARTALGWRATVVIPWSELGPRPRPGDVWGFNFNRENHPEEENSGWAPTRKGFRSVPEWGHLVFAPPGRDGTNGLVGAALAAIARRHAELPRTGWKAGAARVLITPEEPMWMAGYGVRTHAADGKTTDLWAKALVIEDAGGRRGALITLDLLGLERSLSQSICAHLERQFGLRRDQVALSASHTHSGPVAGFNLRCIHFDQVSAGQQALIQAYARELEERIVSAVGQALAALAPATLSWGNGRASFAVNRRMNREGEVPQLRADGMLEGPVDHDVPVLAVRDAAGLLQAVVFGYACHSTTLGLYQWNADYPGYAQTELESLHPGAGAMFWAGCGADQNPLPRGTVERAQAYGHKLAAAVDAVLDGPMRPVVSRLKTRYREIDLPFASLPDPAQVRREAESKDAMVAARARLFLREIEAGRPLSPTYPYPVAQWQLGEDVLWVFLGGEAVVDYALRIKAAQGGAGTWVAAYANDVMGYIPSRRVLLEGGYEAGGATACYGLPAAWAPDIEREIVDSIGGGKGE